MMRTIITVTRHPTLTDTYQVAAKGGKARPGRRDVRGADAAAAKAMDLAISHGSSGYHIFAPAEVIALIPDDMRERK